MTFADELKNYAPFIITALLAVGLLYVLRAHRLAWLGACLVFLACPGFFIAMRLRDLGFHANGGACNVQNARGFMEAMQWVFFAQSLSVLIGSTFLLGGAIRQIWKVGIVTGAILLALSFYVAFFVYFASGMTAVDGYGC